MLIGRIQEQQELREAYESEYSEFVAVYGRRRIGKTFLVRETFNYRFTFEHSGLADRGLHAQLQAFSASLAEAGMEVRATPQNWMSAFALLRQLIKQSPVAKKVIFIDEIPWMDTPRAGFVTALEYFWNSFCSARKDVLLIICGSATSWITSKVLRNHGGLHNRVTYRLWIRPFTLNECELYTQSRKIEFSRYDLLELYMVFGGVPFYWSMLKRGLSVAQNIDSLIFAPHGKLHHEFNELYDSLFKSPQQYVDVVLALGNAGAGLTRNQLVSRCHLDGNGKTTRILDDLQQCGFISKVPTLRLKNQAVFKLIDNFTLFYMKFVKGGTVDDDQFWLHNYLSPQRAAWAGLAFERVCFQHIAQIKKALGIEGIVANVCSWRAKPTPQGEKGAQIDMLIDRADNMVNICEMKFSKTDYTVTQDDFHSMHHRAMLLEQALGKRKSINFTLITVNGVSHSGYWGEFQQIITADQLFSK